MPRSTRPGFPPPALITTTDDLAALCARLAGEEFVTVDTEFMRERTYFPELCVVQLAGTDEVAIIDAQAEGIDLAELSRRFAIPAEALIDPAKLALYQSLGLAWRDGERVGVTPQGMPLLDALLGELVPAGLVAA